MNQPPNKRRVPAKLRSLRLLKASLRMAVLIIEDDARAWEMNWPNSERVKVRMRWAAELLDEAEIRP